MDCPAPPPPLVQALAFHNLRTVSGTLQISKNGALLGVACSPGFGTIGGNFYVHNNRVLEAIKCASLRAVTGNVFIGHEEDDDAAEAGYMAHHGYMPLLHLDLTGLALVSGALSINSLQHIKVLAFPSLVEVGAHLEIYSCIALVSATLDVLQTVGTVVRGYVFFSSVSNLQGISVGSLHTVHGDVQLVDAGITARHP